jgi:hypothetical protein
MKDRNTDVQPARDPNLREIARRHIYKIDKWYRMFGGASSDLLSFEDGTLTLEVRLDKRAQTSATEMALKLAKSWRYERELHGAERFVVYVYRDNRPVGLSQKQPKVKDPDYLSTLVKQIKRMGEPRSDVLEKIVKGRFG